MTRMRITKTESGAPGVLEFQSTGEKVLSPGARIQKNRDEQRSARGRGIKLNKQAVQTPPDEPDQDIADLEAEIEAADVPSRPEAPAPVAATSTDNPCPQCDFTASTPQGLSAHVRAKHPAK